MTVIPRNTPQSCITSDALPREETSSSLLQEKLPYALVMLRQVLQIVIMLTLRIV